MRADSGHRPAVARRASWTDPLTGLWNRRWLAASRAFPSVRRQGRYLAVILFDADSLSRVNDRDGYRIGDTCLVAVGRALAQAFRARADVVRVGGDEFLVPLLVETPQTATQLARAALAVIAAEPELARRQLTVSAGIALSALRTVDADPDWTLFIDQAYRALRRAKRAGGRRVRTIWA